MTKPPIKDIISRYSKGFKPMSLGRTDVNKYYPREGEEDLWRLIVISQLDKPFSAYAKEDEHNIIITVCGENQEAIKKTIDDILEKIGIETRAPPPEMKRMLDAIKSSYELLFSTTQPES